VQEVNILELSYHEFDSLLDSSDFVLILILIPRWETSECDSPP
jgi:hypothetical protein